MCTANVCRSPMAAALLEQCASRVGVVASVSSAGTERHDLPVDPDAVTVMSELGLDIGRHIPRMLDRSIIDRDGADLILTMTRAQLRVVATSAPGALQRAFTVRELARRLTMSDVSADLTTLNHGRAARDLMGDDVTDDISDPYGAGLPRHRECAAELDASLRAIAAGLHFLSSTSSGREGDA